LSEPPQALFVSYTAVLGGAERILLANATALEGPVAVACPDGALADAARTGGLEVLPLSEQRAELRGSSRDRLAAPLRLAALRAEVRRAVVNTRPRCVIGWSMRGVLVAAGALAGMRGAPPLVFCHNDLLPSRGVGTAVRAAASRAQRVVALSHAIAEDLDPRGRLAVQVIHPGVDLERFTPTPLPDGPPEALVLGAIVGWKSPGLALDAAELARRDLPGLTVRLAGAPLGEAGQELWRALEQRVATSGLARLDGGIEDVPGAIAGSTCLLHCADHEPFGVALTEALACGRPVVAPRAAGPLEIVDESCGALYEPGSAAAAAEALVHVVRHAPDMAGPARERAERLFDRRISVRRFRALVEELT